MKSGCCHNSWHRHPKTSHSHVLFLLGHVERWWIQDGKLGITTQDPPRVRKTDTFIVFYLFVLHSVTCLKTCHFTACFTWLWTSISVFYCTSRFRLYLLNIYHFTYTFSHSHTEAHTHKHTCTISTREEWRQPDTGAWLRGAEERLLWETKALHTKNQCQQKPIFTNLKKGFEHIELP